MLLFYQDRHCLSEWAVLWSLLPQDWGGRGEIQQALNLWKLILPPQESKKLATLPSNTTHYLIPFTDVATKFMEVIEFEELSGLIFPQTVVNEIQQSSLKHYRCGRILLHCKRLKVKMFLQADLWLHQKFEKPLCVFPKRILQGSFGQNKHFLTTHVSCSPLIFKEKQVKA